MAKLNGDSAPRFLDAGDTALVVEFGNVIDSVVNDRVLALDAFLSMKTPDGIIETVPTFRSLMIHYDPLVLSRPQLLEIVSNSSHAVTPAHSARNGSTWIIPCCYAPEFAEDILHLSTVLGLTADQIVTLHSGATYRLYMYGFAPGYCYLGGLPAELAISRRVEPRPPTPENVIITAAGMSAITTYPMPTGWWIVGRTPERTFSVDRQPQFFAAVGDNICFEPVSLQEFHILDARSRQGEIIARKQG